LRSTKLYVSQTRVGAAGDDGLRLFVVDFVSGGSCADCNLNALTADVKAGDGEITNIAVRQNSATGGQRVTFEFRPGGAPQTDIRCILKQNGQGISETWIYRWTA
jgi:glucans biosynthesis protein